MERLAAKLKLFHWNIDRAENWPEYRHQTKGRGYILTSIHCRVTKHAATLVDVAGFLKILQEEEEAQLPIEYK